MVGSVSIGDDFAPERGREDDDGEQEESSSHFEPENSANAPERAQEPANPMTDRASGRQRSAALAYGNAALILRTSDRHNGIPGRARRSELPLQRNALARDAARHHARGNAHSDAKQATDSACSHTVYDGSSGLSALRIGSAPPSCPQTGLAVR